MIGGGLKIVLVHNWYGSEAPSGENRVFEAERDLLINNGHAVEVFTRDSDELRRIGTWGLVKGALSTTWNPWSAHVLAQLVQRTRPHIIHVHNTFPLISPAIFHAVRGRVAQVLTLHNYRLYCAAAIPSRSGEICFDCLNARSVLPAMRYGCYRGSRLATAPLATSIALHRAIGTWKTQVDAFIVLSDYQRIAMVGAGLPATKVHVKPNCHRGRPEVRSFSGRDPYVVFVGRLGREKGVVSLVKAWREWGSGAPELRLVGDGELRCELERMAVGVPVRFLGQLPLQDTQAQIAGSRLLVLPSECVETFGLVVLEAFACGTPVAVSDIGPLPSIVEDGVTGIVFAPGQPRVLLSKIRAAWEESGLLERLGARARDEFESQYTEEANYQGLMTIYDKAIAVRRACA